MTDHSEQTAGDDAPSASRLDVEVSLGNPTDAEIAAITAVLAAMADDAGEEARTVASGPSAWGRSQRVLRAPLVPGPHAWKSFPV